MENTIKIVFTQKEPEKLKYSVILSMYQGQWVFVRAKNRDTYEIPGGHIEQLESPLEAAERELYEETGASSFQLWPMGYYGVSAPEHEEISYGGLFFANIFEFGPLPGFEIEELLFSGSLPKNLTYPAIQPVLHQKGTDWLQDNMTTVYMVRHAAPDYTVQDDFNRPLLPEGVLSSKKLPERFKQITIDTAYSSPYIRSVDTIKPLCRAKGLEIITDEGFRERKVGDNWIEDFDFSKFMEMQWAHFDYKLHNGESLGEVQKRNIAALNRVLEDNKGKTVVIGTHGTALSTILNFYSPAFGYKDCMRIVPMLPYIIKIVFLDDVFLYSQEIAI